MERKLRKGDKDNRFFHFGIECNWRRLRLDSFHMHSHKYKFLDLEFIIWFFYGEN